VVDTALVLVVILTEPLDSVTDCPFPACITSDDPEPPAITFVPNPVAFLPMLKKLVEIPCCAYTVSLT
jgi:hypothetical protein